MKPRVADYLRHMRQAAQDAREFVATMGRDEFVQDRRTQQAVIIGEAAT